jgi:hypothetical protein
MSSPVVIAAENAVTLYTRYLREIPTATVPKHWVEELLSQLNALLDEHADLSIAFDPPEYDEVEIEEVEDWGADSPPDDQLESN